MKWVRFRRKSTKTGRNELELVGYALTKRALSLSHAGQTWTPATIHFRRAADDPVVACVVGAYAVRSVMSALPARQVDILTEVLTARSGYSGYFGFRCAEPLTFSKFLFISGRILFLIGANSQLCDKFRRFPSTIHFSSIISS